MKLKRILNIYSTRFYKFVVIIHCNQRTIGLWNLEMGELLFWGNNE